MPQSLRLRSHDVMISSDSFVSNSPLQLHGSDSPLSSDPPDTEMDGSFPSQLSRSRLVPSVASTMVAEKACLTAESSNILDKVSASRRSEHEPMDLPSPFVNTNPLSARLRNKSISTALFHGPTSSQIPLRAQVNKRAGTSRTRDHLTDGGSYALPAPLPLDPRKRLRQEEAFQSVRPVVGEGPYAYYNDAIIAGG